MRASIIFTLFLLLTISISCYGQPSNSSSIASKPGVSIPETTSIVEVLKANGQLSIEQRVALYRELKKEDPKAYSFWNEDELTMYGYGLLWDDNKAEALEIFKLLVAEFPNSANTYDSLGEGYLALGDEKKSLANYQKAFEMDPDNFNAEDVIHNLLHPGVAQETEEEKFDKIYSIGEYNADLDQLSARLLKVHPNALKFITKENFLALVTDKKNLITDKTTYAEFRWHCAEIVASLNCSHTSTGRFSLESKILPTKLRFPVQTRLIGKQLFVVDPVNNEESLQAKDEILTINGLPTAEVVAKIYRRISSQGYVETTKRHEFNTWGTAMIAYALNFPEQYELEIKDKPKVVVLNAAETVRNNFGNHAIKPCQDQLCLEVLEDGKTAILTIVSFNFYRWNNFDVFATFIDDSFKEINAKGIEHLLIDLRYNGGGSPESSIHLLRHLTSKPFTYYSRAEFEGKKEKTEGENLQHPFEETYRGKLYFLIDGMGNSTTGHFMSLVKTWNLGTIVGEELGANQFCSAGQTVCRLSNTKLMYFVANNTHITTATSLPDERGILPDHTVIQSIDDYLGKVDIVKQFALDLTRK
jgi:C-terminal processing protease CtpA/Prc